MRVSDKGQITIPKSVRDLAGIRPNSDVIVSLEGRRVIIEAQQNTDDSAAAKSARIERFLKSLDALEATGDQQVDAATVMGWTRDRFRS